MVRASSAGSPGAENSCRRATSVTASRAAAAAPKGNPCRSWRSDDVASTTTARRQARERRGEVDGTEPRRGVDRLVGGNLPHDQDRGRRHEVAPAAGTGGEDERAPQPLEARQACEQAE